MIGPGVLMSDASDWTITKKAIAVGWMACIDILILALAIA
jgi:hypothetical protein